MGYSTDYPLVPDWVAKSQGYQTGARVKYKGNVFEAVFWGSEPGAEDADHNGFRLYDELYDQTPHTPTTRPKIIGYLPTWEKGFNFSNDMVYQNITHGVIAFLMLRDDYSGEFDPTTLNDVNALIAQVVPAGHRNGARILVSLGGATDYGFLHLMERIGQNPADPLLAQVIQRVATYVMANDLDGVDLDLECWWDANGDPNKDQGGRPASQRPHPAGRGLTIVAQQLKQALPEKIISATTFATSWYGNNYDASLIHYVDWLAVMTYDLTGSWNGTPVGPHTALLKIRNQAAYAAEQQGEWPDPNNQHKGPINNPILSVEDSLWYWSNPFFVDWLGPGQNIPRNKLAAGVPLYGYDFAYAKDPDKQSGQIPPGYQVVWYSDIVQRFPETTSVIPANKKVSGNTHRPSFVAAPGNYNFLDNIYFESIPTAVSKLDFLSSVGAQGVIVWALPYDIWEPNKSITEALYKHAGIGTKPPLLTPNSLTPLVVAAVGITVPFMNSVGQTQETNESPIPLIVETSPIPALTLYIGTVQLPPGIPGPPPGDLEYVISIWSQIEAEARSYRRNDPGAFLFFFSLCPKLISLINWLEAKVRTPGIGWIWVPFYLFVLLFYMCVNLEWIALRFPNPLNPPLPKPPPGDHPDLTFPSPSGSNPNPDKPKPDEPDNQKECETEMAGTRKNVNQVIGEIEGLPKLWPGFDLGPIDTVLHGTPPGSGGPGSGGPGSGGGLKPQPGQFRYYVEVSTFSLFFGGAIGVAFYTENQQKQLATFSGGGFGIGLGAGWSSGTAVFNYDVIAISQRYWAGRFKASYADVGPGETMVTFTGESGEQIGVLTAGGLGLGAGNITGNGDFRLPLTPGQGVHPTGPGGIGSGGPRGRHGRHVI